MRLLMEVIGWIIAAYGVLNVFGENPTMIHYIALIIGGIILLFTIPFKSFRFKKKR